MNAIKDLYTQYATTSAYKSQPDIPEVTETCEAVVNFIACYDKSALRPLGERINTCANAHEMQGFVRGFSYAMRLIRDSGGGGV